MTLGKLLFSETLSLVSMRCVSNPKKVFAVGTFGHTSASLILLVNAKMAGLLQKILVNFSFLSFR